MEYQYNPLAYLENLMIERYMSQVMVEQAYFAYAYDVDYVFLFLRIDMRDMFVNGTS